MSSSFSLPGMESLTPEEMKEVMVHMPLKHFTKGTILLRQGETATSCYFIVKGCIRQFQLIEGREHTTAFYMEQQAVVSFSSYMSGTPADHWIECSEDCTLIEGTHESEREMYQRFPKLAEITRKLMAEDFGKAQSEMAAFMVSTPEERYKNLTVSRPQLLQRFPQHQIASYIGVTPESLSRIRKRLLDFGL